jgi:hypothetical protein
MPNLMELANADPLTTAELLEQAPIRVGASNQAIHPLQDVAFDGSFYYYYMNGMRQSPLGKKMVPEKIVEEPSRGMLTRVKVEADDVDLSDPRRKLAAEAEALLGYTPLRKEMKIPGRLRQVLAKLEIDIFDQEKVDSYKAQMADHYRTAGKMFDPTWRITPLSSYAKPVPEFVLAKAVEIKRELPEANFYIDELAIDPFLIVSMGTLPDFVVNQPSRHLDTEMAVYVDTWSEPKFEATI